jgi:hypothetical protein
MTMAAIAIGVGGAATLGGAYMSSQSAKKSSNAQVQAGREQREFETNRLNEGMVRQLAAILGPQKAMQFLKATLPKDQLETLFGRKGGDVKTQLAEMDNQLESINNMLRDNKGMSKAERDALMAERSKLTTERSKAIKNAKSGASDGNIDENALNALGPGMLDKYSGLADTAEKQGNSLLSQYQAETGTLQRGYGALENQAMQFGKAQEARVNRDTDRALAGANRMAEGRMAARGFGASTALTDAVRGNTMAAEEQRANALGQIGDQRISMLNGLGQNRLGMLSGRLGAGTQLTAMNQDRVMGMRRGVLDTEANALTNQTMNPWANRSAAGYFPGVSGQAGAQGVYGNALGTLGGTAMGFGMLQAFRGNGSGGGGGFDPGSQMDQMFANRPR